MSRIPISGLVCPCPFEHRPYLEVRIGVHPRDVDAWRAASFDERREYFARVETLIQAAAENPTSEP